MASRVPAENLPLAIPGWFDTTTTGRPRSFRRRIARAAPGSNRNSSAERGESGPSGLGTVWLMVPSRSRNTALFTRDPISERVDQQVVEEDMNAFDDRRSKRVDQDRDGETEIGHLGDRAAVKATEPDR